MSQPPKHEGVREEHGREGQQVLVLESALDEDRDEREMSDEHRERDPDVRCERTPAPRGNRPREQDEETPVQAQRGESRDLGGPRAFSALLGSNRKGQC